MQSQCRQLWQVMIYTCSTNPFKSNSYNWNTVGGLNLDSLALLSFTLTSWHQTGTEEQPCWKCRPAIFAYFELDDLQTFSISVVVEPVTVWEEPEGLFLCFSFFPIRGELPLEETSLTEMPQSWWWKVKPFKLKGIIMAFRYLWQHIPVLGARGKNLYCTFNTTLASDVR